MQIQSIARTSHLLSFFLLVLAVPSDLFAGPRAGLPPETDERSGVPAVSTYHDLSSDLAELSRER